MTTVEWYGGGQKRAQVAAEKIMELVGHLNMTTEQPLRVVLAAYYTELLRQQSGSNLYVFDRLSLAVSSCLRKNKIVLSPENSRRLNEILALNYIRYF